MTASGTTAPNAAAPTWSAAGGGGEVRQAGEPRNARLETVRGVMAMTIVGGHAYAVAHLFAPSSQTGVVGHLMAGVLGFPLIIFFALSGYLLYRPFAAQAFDSGGPVDLRRFARNRALRVLTLYFAAVIIMLVFTQGGGTWTQWWRFATITACYFQSTAGTVDGPLWSLMVELTFYMLLPLLAWGVSRLSRGSLRRGALVLLVVAAGSIAFRVVFYLTGDHLNPSWNYNLGSYLFAFVAGMLMVLVRIRWRQTGPPRWLRPPLDHSHVWLLGALGLWVLSVVRLDWDPIQGGAALLTLGALVLPLRQGWALRFFDWRPFVAIGVASYSLYVWHAPVLERLWIETHAESVALFCLTLAACIPIALGSYRLIEAPFLRRRRSWSSLTPGAQRTAREPAPAVETPTVVGRAS